MSYREPEYFATAKTLELHGRDAWHSRVIALEMMESTQSALRWMSFSHRGTPTAFFQKFDQYTGNNTSTKGVFCERVTRT
jgi:hypothetical protein